MYIYIYIQIHLKNSLLEHRAFNCNYNRQSFFPLWRRQIGYPAVISLIREVRARTGLNNGVSRQSEKEEEGGGGAAKGQKDALRREKG